MPKQARSSGLSFGGKDSKLNSGGIYESDHRLNKPRKPSAAIRSKKLKLAAERKALPIFNDKARILEATAKYDTVIVVGETGSGKTTQIPQYLHEADRSRGIAITQPRRVAATSVAERVSQEVGVKLGTTVGYTIRFDDKSDSSTKIKFLTDGMLLRQVALRQPSDDEDNKDLNSNDDNHLLLQYGVIILDEAHERSIHTDILFGLLKQIQAVRRKMAPKNHLKLIVMSATLTDEVQLFTQYFSNATQLYIRGRQFPVTVLYSKGSIPDYIDGAITTVLQIHLQTPLQAAQKNSHRKWMSYGSDILVFLTGQEEIENVKILLQEKIKHFPSTVPRLLVCPLYGALSPKQQQHALLPAPQGCRKVVLSTNIAETSITIEGVKFVVDTGVSKIRQYKSTSRSEMLLIKEISKAEAWQRSGRAGRQQPGTCYRLYEEKTFLELKPSPIPEILRCNLAATVLQLKALHVDDVIEFPYLLAPSRKSLLAAQSQLVGLGALNVGSYAMSALGHQMALFPLVPELAKIVLMSTKDAFACAEEILIIVSMMSADVLFVNPPLSDNVKVAKARAARNKFSSKLGDHLTYLFLYQEYARQKHHDRVSWCTDHFVNSRSLAKVEKILRQLTAITTRLNLPIRSGSADLDVVRKCLVTGFFDSVANRQSDGSYLTVFTKKSCLIHPTSVLATAKPEWVIYNEMVHTSRKYLRNVTTIDMAWLAELEPKKFNALQALSSGYQIPK